MFSRQSFRGKFKSTKLAFKSHTFTRELIARKGLNITLLLIIRIRNFLMVLVMVQLVRYRPYSIVPQSADSTQ